MKTEEFNEKIKAIPNKELAAMAHWHLETLCNTGGHSFTMTVPPRIDDTDIVLSELITRFEALLQANNIELKQPVMLSLPTVAELREANKDRPDTFLTGALYVIDLIEGKHGNGA